MKMAIDQLSSISFFAMLKLAFEKNENNEWPKVALEIPKLELPDLYKSGLKKFARREVLESLMERWCKTRQIQNWPRIFCRNQFGI